MTASVWTLRAALVACAAMALAAAPLAAQEDAARKATVAGQVVDNATGAPLAQAQVYFERLGLSAVTDAEGRFQIRNVPVGKRMVTVYRIGYDEFEEEWEVGPGAAPFQVKLTPDPVVLEELTVQLDIYQRRRDATPTSVRVVDRDELLSTTAVNAAQVLADRGYQFQACGNGLLNCIRSRGSLARVSVVIDEAPVAGGIAQLQAYDPDDLYMVEVYGNGRHIRAYTTWFMESQAKRGMRPTPVVFF